MIKHKEKKIERALRLTMSSLESHLKYTHAHSSEGKTFHKKCVREYGEVINILSELI